MAHTEQGKVPEKGTAATNRLRMALLIGFGGWLALLLTAGVGAFQTLRKLSAAEETVRRDSLVRSGVLSTVIVSAHAYTDQVEEYVLKGGSPGYAGDPAAIIKRAEEAHSSLQTYPQDRNPQEQLLIDNLDKELLEEENAFRAAMTWTLEQRRRDGAQMLSEEILPRRVQLVAMSQQIAVLNEDRSREADQGILATFGNLQVRLTRMLVLVLGSGFLLSLISAVYILRLERQGRLRYEELSRSRRDLENLPARLLDAQETERRTISRELHDEVGQSLGALLLDVGRLSNLLPAGDAPIQEELREIKAVAERTVQVVRNMALLLRPSMLDDLGLVPALEAQGRETSRRGDMEVEVQAENVSDNLPDEYKICIYRLVQEALNNATRHSAAKHAHVTIIQKKHTMLVNIVDDGRGFESGRPRGLGLLGMDERVKRLGGKLSIDGRPGQGASIRVELPLPPTASSVSHEENSDTAVRRS